MWVKKVEIYAKKNKIIIIKFWSEVRSINNNYDIFYENRKLDLLLNGPRAQDTDSSQKGALPPLADISMWCKIRWNFVIHIELVSSSLAKIIFSTLHFFTLDLSDEGQILIFCFLFKSCTL